MGSRGHVVGRLPVRILETSLSLRGVKEGNIEPLVAEVAPERDLRRGDRGLLNEPNIEAN